MKKLTKNSILNYDELKFLGDQLNRDYDDDNLRQVSVNLIAKLNGENEYSQIEKLNEANKQYEYVQKKLVEKNNSWDMDFLSMVYKFSLIFFVKVDFINRKIFGLY